MNVAAPILMSPGDRRWPFRLTERLGEAAPTAFRAVGPLALLDARRTALFCSANTPGAAILRAHDTARQLRDGGVTVISGFHSPLEKECLLILLRGRQPIIMAVAREIQGIRIPTDCRAAFQAGRLLFLSAVPSPKRVTRESAMRRNEVAAALADEVFFAHITPGGHTERLSRMVEAWDIPAIPRCAR